LSLFTWGRGRHDTGYKAFTLIYSKRFWLDCYLIRYPTGASIPLHKDPIKNGKMYRLNIEFWKPKEGGKFHSNTLFSLFGRIHLFRPDIEEHYVTPVTKGERWVFSIGKILKQ